MTTTVTTLKDPTSGETYAVELDPTGRILRAAGPLHYEDAADADRLGVSLRVWLDSSGDAEADAAWLACRLAETAGDWRDVDRYYGGPMVGGILPVALVPEVVESAPGESVCGWNVDWEASGYSREDAEAGRVPDELVVFDPGGRPWTLTGIRDPRPGELLLTRLLWI